MPNRPETIRVVNSAQGEPMVTVRIDPWRYIDVLFDNTYADHEAVLMEPSECREFAQALIAAADEYEGVA